MKTCLALALAVLLVSGGAYASDRSAGIKGVLYFTNNLGVGSDTESRLSARFVPASAQSTNYVTIKNPAQFALTLLGQHEVVRLSKNPMRIIEVPVVVTLSDRQRVMECDAPTEHATLVSARALSKALPVSRDAAPIGC